MRKGLLAGYPPFTQLIMTFLTMVVCGLLLTFAGMLFAPLVTGLPLPDVIGMMNNGEIGNHLGLMRYLQTVQSFSLFIIPAFFLGYLFSGSAVEYFGFCKISPGNRFALVLLIMLMAIPCINLLASLNEMIVFPKSLSWLEIKLRNAENAAADITKLFLSVDNIGGMLFNVFMIALLPAVGEEFIFRGVIQKILARWTGNIHVAVIVAGFLFSLMHMQFYGFFPRWLLGAMFGYLLVWSGSIWLPIFAHFVNNTLAVIVSYLIHKGIIPEEIEIFGSSWSEIPVTVITAAICGWLLWRMYRISQQTTTTVETSL